MCPAICKDISNVLYAAGRPSRSRVLNDHYLLRSLRLCSAGPLIYIMLDISFICPRHSRHGAFDAELIPSSKAQVTKSVAADVTRGSVLAVSWARFGVPRVSF